jgi:predicted outer membrane repeat protein
VKVISSALSGVLCDMIGTWQRYSPVMNHRIHAFVFILIVAFACHAIDVQVTATGGLSGPNCGSAVSNACGSLKDGWSVCQSNSSEPCNMYLQPGHYVGPNNTALNFGSAVISIVGIDKSGNTILDGESSHNGLSSAGNITLDGIVLQNYIYSALTWKPTIPYSLLEVSNGTFVGNRGDKGGALSLQPTASTVTAVVNASFTGNRGVDVSDSPIGGGAIYARASGDSSIFNLMIGDNVQFMNNIAADRYGNGGAIYARASGESSTVSIILGDNAQFVNNKAADSGLGNGGALYAQASAASSTVSIIIGDNAQFVNNKASERAYGYGGGISAEATGYTSSTINITIGDNCQFVNNVASGKRFGRGGAIYTYAFGNAFPTINLMIGFNAQFLNNVASKSSHEDGVGGSIFAMVSPHTSTITCTIRDNAQFVQNTAGAGHGSGSGYGSAIYAESYTSKSSTITFTIGKNVLFLSNQATKSMSGNGYGGVIYAKSGFWGYSTMTFLIGDNAKFVDNIAAVTANGRGGAIYIEVSGDSSSTANIMIGDNAQFVNNVAAVTAIGQGGAIYAKASGNSSSTINITIGGYAEFENNTAALSSGEGEGGAIYVEVSGQYSSTINLVIRDAAQFVRNVAAAGHGKESGYGSAIYAKAIGEANSTINLVIGDNGQFINNTAALSLGEGSGGAIYTEASGHSSTAITFTIGNNTRFVNNVAAVTAGGKGGAIYADASGHSLPTITFTIGDNAQFVNNTAAGSTDGQGGAIYTKAFAFSSTIALMIGDNAQFVSNTAAVTGGKREGGAFWSLAVGAAFSDLSIGKKASFEDNIADAGSIGFWRAVDSNNFTISIGEGPRIKSQGESGCRIALTKSRGSLHIGKYAAIDIPYSVLSVSLFQQSSFTLAFSGALVLHCEKCLTTESFDSSSMQLSIVNSTFTGIKNYALSVLSAGASEQDSNSHINIISSSFDGTSDASAILGTASNAGKISITAVDCNFTSFSSQSDGGAIQVIAVADSYLSVDVINCRFNDTAALDGTNGGGIASTCFSSSCSLNISDTSFQNASAGLGGAVAMLDDGGSTCTMSITNSEFKDCLATSGGGAIYSKRVKALNVTSTSFVTNRAASKGSLETSGGAIFATGPGPLYINSCKFNGNEASSGGAIAMSDAVNSVLETTSFSNNRAITGNGGAIGVTGEGNAITFENRCILTGNHAALSGGAVYVSGESNSTKIQAYFLGVSCQDNVATIGGCLFTDEYTDLTLDSTFSASGNRADYGADVAATDITENSATLSSEPKYDAPNCLKLPKQPIVVSPGIDASGLFTFEIVDVHGTTVEKVDSSFLVQITSEDGAMTVAGGSKTVDPDTNPKDGKIAFGDIAFTSTSLQPAVAKFEVTPPFSPHCEEMPTLTVQFTECPATYYLNAGACVQCPDGEYKLTKGNDKCDKCVPGGICFNGTMLAAPGYWCGTITLEGTNKVSCQLKPDESRLYQCSGPGCLGGLGLCNTPFIPDEKRFKYACKEADSPNPTLSPSSFAAACDKWNGYKENRNETHEVLCAECQQGHTAKDNKCIKCPEMLEKLLSIIDGLVALALIIFVIFYTLLYAGNSNTILALSLFYFQNVIILPVPFEGINFGTFGTILGVLPFSPAVLIPVSMGLSLVTFCVIVLSMGTPPLVRLLRRLDLKIFSWQQLALAGVSGNISLAAFCVAVAIAVYFLPGELRPLVLVLLLLILLPLSIAVVVFLVSITILILFRRPLLIVDHKGALVVAVSALGCSITICCSLFVVVDYIGIVNELKNIPLLEPTLQFSFPFLTFVLPTVANLNIADALLELTKSCATPWNYYARLLAGLCNPVLLLGILWLAYPGSLLVNWGLGFLSDKTHPVAGKINAVIRERLELKKFTIASLEVLLGNFTSYSTTVVGFFACRNVKNEGWFLNQENSIECYLNNPIWVLLAPLAFLGVIYAVVLLPIAYLSILAISRFQDEWMKVKWLIGYDDSKRPLVAPFEVMHWVAETFRFLLSSTRPNTFYWPVTIVFRRILIVVVYVWLVEGDFQIAGAVIMALFYFMFVPVQSLVNPFALKTFNILEVIVLTFLGVCAMLYVLVEISLLYTETSGDIYYSGITDVINSLFWPLASIPILVAVVIWVINQLPEKKKVAGDGKETSEDNEDDNRSPTSGFSLTKQEHSDPLMEALLAPDNEDEDSYL